MDEDEERPFPRITLWEFLGGMLIGALSWYSMISNPIMRFFLSMGDEAERRSSERRTHISGEGLEPLSLGIRRLAVAIVALLLAGTTGLSAEAEGMPQRSNPRLTCEPWPSCAGTDEGPPPRADAAAGRRRLSEPMRPRTNPEALHSGLLQQREMGLSGILRRSAFPSPHARGLRGQRGAVPPLDPSGAGAGR